MFSQCVVCCFLQVSKREITESGWVRPTDVSSGEPVWLRQQPQLSLPSLSDRLCPRSAAPVIVSSHSRPPLSSPSISLLPLFPSVCVLLFTPFTHSLSVKSLPSFPSCLHPFTCSHFDLFCFDAAGFVFIPWRAQGGILSNLKCPCPCWCCCCCCCTNWLNSNGLKECQLGL